MEHYQVVWCVIIGFLCDIISLPGFQAYVDGVMFVLVLEEEII